MLLLLLQDMNGQRVSEEEVQQLLEAANWAPTHGKTEPWRFAVLSGREAQLRAFELFLQVPHRHPVCDKLLLRTANRPTTRVLQSQLPAFWCRYLRRTWRPAARSWTSGGPRQTTGSASCCQTSAT